MTLHFEINAQSIKLVENRTREFRHFVDKPMSPGDIFRELYKCGVNLMPEPKDASNAGFAFRNFYEEDKAILDIATSLKLFAFQST